MQAGENVRQFSLCHFFARFLLLFVLDGVGWRLLTLESTPDGEGGGGGTNVNKNNCRRRLRMQRVLAIDWIKQYWHFLLKLYK